MGDAELPLQLRDQQPVVTPHLDAFPLGAQVGNTQRDLPQFIRSIQVNDCHLDTLCLAPQPRIIEVREGGGPGESGTGGRGAMRLGKPPFRLRPGEPC